MSLLLLTALFSLDSCTPSEICRLRYPLLPAYTPTVLYSLFALVLIVLFYGVYRKFSIYGIGWAEISENLPKLITNGRRILSDGFGQRKILQRRYGGLMHSWMFYGIAALIAGTTLVGIDYDLLRPNGIVLLQGDFYLGFKVFLDIFGLAFVVSVVLALTRRALFKPFYMGVNSGDRFILLGLLYMGVSGFVQEGLRLALIPAPWAYFSPVGSVFMEAFSFLGAGPSSSAYPAWVSTYQTLWWIHAAVAFALIASIPYAKLFHAPNALVNMMLKDEQRPPGRMSTPFNLAAIMKEQESNPDYTPDLTIGMSSSKDLKWNHRIMLDACTNCGRCEAACPANAAGRDLSPRLVVQDLKNRFYADRGMRKKQPQQQRGGGGEIPDFFESGTVREVEMYSCVSCSACVYECPVDINHLEFIYDIRRSIVASNRLDPAQNTLLSNLASHQNPYGFSNSSRADWAKDVEGGVKTIDQAQGGEFLLYWVGCLSSFDQRAQKIARALSKIMNRAGVSFAILGAAEVCNGDPARRLGEEGRYQELAMQNIATLNASNVKKIVTSCPHCFNTLKNEYPEFGGNYEVIHHTQLISELIREGKIKISERALEKITVTLHDACYAARYNNIFDEPREILQESGANLKEMPRRREKTFCCGAGGSNYWYKVPQRQTITSIRTQEASATGASTLATECPYCLSMFEDSTKVTGAKLDVKDIAELVAEEL